jgi:CRISPR/Cas system-associated protein Csm6
MPASTGTKCPATGAATIAASLWGTGGVLYILAKAIVRVLPIALEPFQAGAVPLKHFELGCVSTIYDTKL